MKHLLWAVVLISLLFACSTEKQQPPFAKESDQYKFFQSLADSLQMKALNPDKPATLVTTKIFKVNTFDIMPGIYSRFGRYKNNVSRVPKDQLKNTLIQGAQNEADKRLLLNKAKAEGIAVADSAVNAELEEIYSRRGGKENFQKFIEQQGFTLAFVEDDIRSQMTIQKFLEEVLEKTIVVSDQDLQEAYQEDKSANVRHILFLTQGKTEEQKAEVRKKAEEVLARAKNNEDFGQLAAEFSEDPGSKDRGGLYENVTHGRMVKEFEEASFNLPIGVVSDLVETVYGYHILKVESRQKETLPFEEVKDQLERSLERSKRRDAYNNLLEELKKQNNYKEQFEILG